MTETSIEHFDNLYKKLGSSSQRSYPNEELCRFIGRNFNAFSLVEKQKIRILEVGCGSGGNLWMLAREGFEAHGLDSSAEGLALCNQILEEKWQTSAKLQQGQFTKLPYDAGFFDCVVDVVSLEHQNIADHKKSLHEIRRILKPKHGKLFSYHLSENSYPFWHHNKEYLDSNTVSGIDNPVSPFHGAGLTCFISASLYREMLLEAGFVSVNIERVTKTYANQSVSVEYLSVEART